jgi:hypothetical protein
MDAADLRQRKVAGFLIGLGIGLVLGIVFQPARMTFVRK